MADKRINFRKKDRDDPGKCCLYCIYAWKGSVSDMGCYCISSSGPDLPIEKDNICDKFYQFP